MQGNFVRSGEQVGYSACSPNQCTTKGQLALSFHFPCCPDIVHGVLHESARDAASPEVR